ncbi:MAG: glycosyltransferase family 4 protein [Nanoarchaeota archaeon]|nr:glycosyltransferase family 4 protein [Nanoarchaeota archaeon]
MRVLFVSEYFPPKVLGGGEINLAQLTKGLAQSGVEVAVLTGYFSGLAKEELVGQVRVYRRLRTGATPHSLWSNVQRLTLFPGSVAKEVRRLSLEFQPDVIHFIGTSLIAAPKLRGLKKPLFATIESYPALCPKGDRFYKGRQECKQVCSLGKFFSCQRASSEIGKMKNGWFVKYNPFLLLVIYHYYQRLRQALSSCHLIAISTYVQNVLSQHGHYSTVIGNAFDATLFQRKLKKKKGTKEGHKPIVLYLGSLLRSKGPQVFLQAAKGLDCRCELYGAGPLQKELQRYIDENKLDAVIYPPVSPEKIPEVYATADIVVYPSLWPEPFGRIPLEARMAGVPVIASAIGGITETTMSGITFVTPANTKDLREALQREFKTKATVKNSSFPNSLGREVISVLSDLYNTNRNTLPFLNRKTTIINIH